jgi:hypothetical protein
MSKFVPNPFIPDFEAIRADLDKLEEDDKAEKFVDSLQDYCQDYDVTILELLQERKLVKRLEHVYANEDIVPFQINRFEQLRNQERLREQLRNVGHWQNRLACLTMPARKRIVQVCAEELEATLAHLERDIELFEGTNNEDSETSTSSNG